MGNERAGASEGSRYDGSDKNSLFQRFERELRSLAARYLRDERRDHTLQPTALIHEAWIRFADEHPDSGDERAYFLRSAARTMRHVLIDHARRKNRARRGGAWKRVALQDGFSVLESGDEALLAVDDALERLHVRSEELALLVELHFYAGLQLQEVAEVLGKNLATVRRDWAAAKALLRHLLAEASGDPPQ